MAQTPRCRKTTCLVVGTFVLLTLSTHWTWGQSIGRSNVTEATVVPTFDSQRMALEDRISELIEQLGSGEYATREKAQVELERLGLDAFDALNQAQHNDDIEIALRAQYLVRGMQVNWSRDDDPERIKQLLSQYGGKSEDERRAVMSRLAALPDGEGIDVLCRLMRYEASPKLSKIAALIVMDIDVSDDPDRARQLATGIRASVGTSRRLGASWLLTHASLLMADEAALDRCKQIVEQEQELLAQFADQTTPKIARNLLRWYSDQLLKQDRRQESSGVMLQMVDLLDGTRQDILNTIDWLRVRNSWQIVLVIGERFPQVIDGDPLLLYRLADAELNADRKADSQKTAEKAFRAGSNKQYDHFGLAYALQRDGMFHWAEFEYRHLIEQPKTEPANVVTARSLLSEMYHELGNDIGASQVLKELLSSIQSDERVREIVESTRDVGGIQSRMLFFKSLDHGSRNEAAEQKQCLEQGFESCPSDVDVLIAMYRLPTTDENWRKVVTQRITDAVKSFRTEIVDCTKQMRKPFTVKKPEDLPSIQERLRAARKLATANNQLAWLVANTEGDFDEAIECSKQAIKLEPEAAGYLDTLGRCYYAKGDFKNAVESQSKAVSMEPHSRPMLAQLEMFKKALSRANQKKQDE